MQFTTSTFVASLLAITSATPLVSRQGPAVNNAPDIVSGVKARYPWDGPQEKKQKAVMLNVLMSETASTPDKQLYLPVHLNQLTLCMDENDYICYVTKINHASASISDAGGFDGTGLACQAYQDAEGLIPIGRPFAEDITVDIGGERGATVASVMCTLQGVPQVA